MVAKNILPKIMREESSTELLMFDLKGDHRPALFQKRMG